MPSEQQRLDSLRAAETSGDASSLEGALGKVASYYVVQRAYAIAAPYWQRQAMLLEQMTASDSRELGTFLHNMAALCLIPAGQFAEARAALVRAKEVYRLHFGPEDDLVRQVDKLIHGIPT